MKGSIWNNVTVETKLDVDGFSSLSEMPERLFTLCTIYCPTKAIRSRMPLWPCSPLPYNVHRVLHSLLYTSSATLLPEPLSDSTPNTNRPQQSSVMAQNFVAQLPVVPRADLVYGNQCGICREDYGTNIAGSDIVTEDTVRLP